MMKFVREETPSSFVCETAFRIWLERYARRVLLSAGAPGMEDHQTFGTESAAVSRALDLAGEWGVRWCGRCGSWHAPEGHAWCGECQGWHAVGNHRRYAPGPQFAMVQEARRRDPRCSCGRMRLGTEAYVAGHSRASCD